MRKGYNIQRARLAGFTLSECLIVMIVGGLIFLGVTEGLGMFMGYTSSRADRVQYEQQVFDDLMALNGVLSVCDSMKVEAGTVRVYRDGMETVVSCPEERIILKRENLSDTLLYRHRAGIEVTPDKETKLGEIKITAEYGPELLVLEYSPRLSPAAEMAGNIEKTEEGFGYE